MDTDQQASISAFKKKLKVPAVAAGVLSQDGRLDFQVQGIRYRGGDEQAQAQDQWHIGSCTKSMTAALYARLVELGMADWGSSVASMFPDLKDQLAVGWAERTMEQLFICEAGMRANPELSEMKAAYEDTRSLPEQRTTSTLSAMRDGPKPSGKFLYSNLSYIVIGAAIDRLTGTSYEEALSHYLFQPLGIETAGFGAPPKIYGHSARLRAGMLLFRGTPRLPELKISDNPPVFSSAGTLHLSIEDWAKFLTIYLSRGGSLLKAETIDYLLTRPSGAGEGMAKGWAEAKGLAGVSYGMQGSNTMWSATALMDDKRARMALVLCNDGRSRVLTASAKLAANLLALENQK